MSPAPIQQSPEPSPQLNVGTANQLKDRNLDVLRSLRMHRGLAITVAAIVFIVVFAYGLTRRPYYETQALIYVQPMKAKLITESTSATYDASRYETFVQQQLQTIMRADILTEALTKPSTRAWRFPGEPLRAAVTRLQQNLKVDRVTGSYELSIGLSGGNPVAIADVVNAVSNAYIRGERADELAQSDKQMQILQDELQRVSSDLSNDRRQQAALSVSLGVADTSGVAGNPYDVQLADLRAELSKAISARDIASTQADFLSNGETGSSKNLQVAADDAATTDPGLAALKQTIGQRRSLLTSQMAGLTPQNPLYKQYQEELSQLDESQRTMENEIRLKTGFQLQRKSQLEARRAADIVARLSQELATKTAIATGATPQLQHAADLNADIARLQARYNEVGNALSSIQLERDTSGLVHILVAAEPPLAPKTSRKLIILGASLPLAILVAVIAAVLARRFDPRIYSGSDIARVLRFYPMAILPKTTDVNKRVSDEFALGLIAGIDQIHRTDGSRTFVFTATSPRSDIAELVESLSRKMERLGYDIVTMKTSELVQSRAISSGFFADPNTEPAIMKPTMHENFVAQRIETITRKADFLFIEAPPLLSSSEAEFALRLSDVAILVPESGKTTRAELVSSLALVKRLVVPAIVCALSEVSIRNADDDFVAAVRIKEERYGGAA